MRLLGPAALVLLLLACAVPVDPQWRALRVAETMLTRDLDTPLSELRYPGQPRPARRAQPQTQTQRSRRQYKGFASQKQSTFSLLRQLIGETATETRSAFNQIADILGSQFADTATARPTTTSTSLAPANDANSTGNATTTTTTEAPYRLSRQELLGILHRNSVGLGRLFRKEYDQAMQDSKVNLNRFKQEFRMAVAPFLQPATTEAPSSTTSS